MTLLHATPTTAGAPSGGFGGQPSAPAVSPPELPVAAGDSRPEQLISGIFGYRLGGRADASVPGQRHNSRCPAIDELERPETDGTDEPPTVFPS